MAGTFLGAAHGAAAGAAITVILGLAPLLVRQVQMAESLSVEGRVDTWITACVAAATLGAALGAFNGAVLGRLQGLLTARARSASRPRLRRFAVFCWASVAAAWCLLIDQSVPFLDQPGWLLHLTFLLAPATAGLGGAVTASRLARVAWGGRGTREPNESL